MCFSNKNSLLLMLSGMFVQYSHAIDVNVGDYTALPKGTNAGVFYYQHSQMEGYYQNGEKTRAESKSDIGIARFIHYTDIAGLRATPQIILPFGTVRHTQIGDTDLNNASGFADPVIASAFWLINRPEQGSSGRYLAFTPFIYLPVGQYDRNDAVNLGENRFKYDLQLAWVQPLYGKFAFELYQDVIWYGDNDEAGKGDQTLSQATSYQTQFNLRYDLNSKQRIAFGYAANYGGEQQLDGIKLDQNMEKQQARLEFQQMLNAKTQLSAQLLSDTRTESGFKKDYGLNFRVFYIF
ncbi:transporter [Acinetobacter sp. RIT698]|uniref:transporter n=1 Tax=Acinetobacter TaxID=469 RepID=UPI00125F425C|nr:transporter [Acinetobacter guillouiae]MRT38888.1 transporter [Acinetobacter sp. RIT698]